MGDEDALRKGRCYTPKGRAGVVLRLAMMAGSDVSAAPPGLTNPTTWGLDSWVSDIVPHLAYGLMTAVAYDAFNGLVVMSVRSWKECHVE